MIQEIHKDAGIPAKPAIYLDPPPLHAVWFDSIDGDGADLGPSQIFTHDCTVELYAPDIASGNAALQRLIKQLDERNIHYDTQGWYWLKEIRRYQEVITFTYYNKQQEDT